MLQHSGTAPLHPPRWHIPHLRLRKTLNKNENILKPSLVAGHAAKEAATATAPVGDSLGLDDPSEYSRSDDAAAVDPGQQVKAKWTIRRCVDAAEVQQPCSELSQKSTCNQGWCMTFPGHTCSTLSSRQPCDWTSATCRNCLL